MSDRIVLDPESVMREYRHKVHWPLIEDCFDMKFNDSYPRVMRQLVEHKPKSARYVFSTALRSFFESLTTSWALGDDEAFGVARERTEWFVRYMLDESDAEVLQAELSFGRYSAIAVGVNAELLLEMTQRTKGRAHSDNPDAVPGADALHDAVIGLVLGDDAAALAAVDVAEAGFASPAYPPHVIAHLLLPVLRAVCAGDQAVFDETVEGALVGFAKYAKPTRDSHASPFSLINDRLTLLCRVARWRGMTVPESSYIVPYDEVSPLG